MSRTSPKVVAIFWWLPSLSLNRIKAASTEQDPGLFSDSRRLEQNGRVNG